MDLPDTTTDWERGVRDQFPMFRDDVGEPRLAYLDNGATTQKPQSVIDATSDFYGHHNGNVGRGVYRLSMGVGERYERARETVRRFLGASASAEIVFTRNTTDSVNMVARGFGDLVVGAEDEVLVTGMEHHSNLLPWQMLCRRQGARLTVVPTGADGRIDLDTYEALLGPRTKLVAVAHISNVLGTVNPVAEMAELAHRREIPVLVDGAQAVSRRPVDVRELGADFYVLSAHKMYGPTGLGVLYGRQELLERMDPPQLGGGTAKGVTFDGRLELMQLPARLEAGTPNIAGAVGTGAAIDFLDGCGWEEIVNHEARLLTAAVDGLSGLPGVRVLGDPVRDPGGIVSFVVDGVHPYDVGNHLNDLGIAVRTGVHCAIPFVDSLELVGTVRASFGVYNTLSEVARLVEAVRTVEAGDWTRERPTLRFL